MRYHVIVYNGILNISFYPETLIHMCRLAFVAVVSSSSAQVGNNSKYKSGACLLPVFAMMMMVVWLCCRYEFMCVYFLVPLAHMLSTYSGYVQMCVCVCLVVRVARLYNKYKHGPELVLSVPLLLPLWLVIASELCLAMRAEILAVTNEKTTH